MPSLDFHNGTILIIFSSLFTESFWNLAPDCLMVLGAEFLVDWIKHAFITRFNEVSADVYKNYTIFLAYDLAQTKQKHVSYLLLFSISTVLQDGQFAALKNKYWPLIFFSNFDDFFHPKSSILWIWGRGVGYRVFSHCSGSK